jgi:sec-independent protein translocase protein TatC
MDPTPEFQASAATTPASPARTRRRRPRWMRLPWHPAADKTPAELETLTLVDHLVELRNRIFISVLALLPGTVLGYLFAGQIIEVLKRPLPTSEPLVVLGLTDAFMIDLKIALTTGFIVGMPVILYQLWRFISPGLTAKERSAARPWVPLALLFFALGVSVAYFILPYASGFLYTFQTKDIHLMLTADSYFGFVTTLFIAFGVVMEFPILLVLLAKVGILSSQRLSGSRRMALVGIVTFSALITPGADIVSPIVMAVVMYGLFEVSIVMIRMQGR